MPQIARIFKDFAESIVTESRMERREQRSRSAVSITERSALMAISENNAA